MGNSPPIKETITPDCDIASIIRAEGWLNDTASAYSAKEIPEQLRAQIGRLLLSELVRVHVVVLVRLATCLVPGLEELWDTGVV